MTYKEIMKPINVVMVSVDLILRKVSAVLLVM